MDWAQVDIGGVISNRSALGAVPPTRSSAKKGAITPWFDTAFSARSNFQCVRWIPLPHAFQFFNNLSFGYAWVQIHKRFFLKVDQLGIEQMQLPASSILDVLKIEKAISDRVERLFERLEDFAG
ncbi:hypothetical protein [Pseudomonas nunensis]|uniref:hypothetical protein n=1 Tax=Pseudomonas nunensis TaxID=2961896 RepID=UPI0025B0BE68|nr:hypothetical protein [Pseudomonas nunensis]MDN3221355.1 hypothetical protein [Pseudomonas nunensis]